MKKSLLNRRSDKLRKLENKFKIQPDGRQGDKVAGYGKDTSPTAGKPPNIEDKVSKVTSDILNKPVGTFHSSWAQGIQKELQKAAEVASKRTDMRRDRGERERLILSDTGGWLWKLEQ